MGILLLAGNSKYVNSELLRTKLDKQQWTDRVTHLLVPDSNQVLVEAAKQLALTVGMDIDVIQVPWQREVKQPDGTFAVEQNRGALYQIYQTLVPKVHAIMAFSTGDDRAVDALNRDANNLRRPCVIHKVMPNMVPSLTSLAVENPVDREALKAIARAKLAKLAVGEEPTSFTDRDHEGEDISSGGKATGDFFPEDESSSPSNGHDSQSGWE